MAAKKNVTLPKESDDVKKWSNKKASEVDEDYVKHMISAHKALIDLFEKAAKSNDADIASFANSHLQDLRSHYTKAEALKNQVKS